MHLSRFQKQIKLIGGGVLVLVVLGGVIFAGKGASSFMAKASVCPAQNVKATQVAANSAVVSWDTTDVSQGKVEYGTNATNLTFSQVEASSGTTHNLPLTLLTPNTVYYYLITIGNKRCDYSGQTCDTTCVPWSFTTTSAAGGANAPIVVSHTPTPAILLSPTKTPSPTTGSATGSSTLSAFCQKVQQNLGASNKDTANWASLKQYDIDGNGVINSLDIIKCQKAGK